MRVLVTGATGFIGRHVVAALLREGHSVHALARQSSAAVLPCDDRVKVHHGDVRARESLAHALRDIDAVIHLAGSPTDPDAWFATFVVGTEHLVAAMAECGVRRLVLESSFAVDNAALQGVIDERSPLEPAPYTRDGYSLAKIWQKRVVRQATAELGPQVRTVRPGLVWGPGYAHAGSVGLGIGPVRLLFGARTILPLTFVENCARCFVAALSPTAVGEYVNVIDADEVTAWRCQLRLVIPYEAAFASVRSCYRLAQLLLGPSPRHPGVLGPRRFEARFKPRRYRIDRARALLHGSPIVSFEEATCSLADASVPAVPRAEHV